MNSTFNTFWTIYPRRIGKRAAEQAWERSLKRGSDPEAIVEGARRYAADRTRESRYTKHPATWLNQDCHLDEPDERPTLLETTRAAQETEPVGNPVSFSEWLGRYATDEERERAHRLGLGRTETA